MNPSDYQKVKEIFNLAVELPPEERGTFLDVRCGGDSELRSEVERLLDSLDDEFLERPAVEPISSPTVSGVSLSGQRVGHYNVIRKIGSGGMGDVYLATDGKLGRRVAVKILPEEFTSEQDRLDRFQLEARAASALSHPNILTIHEIGEWAGTHYIATEYVEGETLRHRISRERLSVPETLEVGVQLVSAIAAAHEAGICHRDIKPENIMIRRDGIIKVVDFGLVKLTPSLLRGNPARPTSAGDPTVKIVRTEPGVIMGTVQYMSPEQTRSLPTDERSDIWSLGCVLYEMLAGRAPFEGENSADLIAEIVKTYPAPPSSLNSDVPERLDEIVGKALEKNPDERYQTAKDLLIDLKRLKRRFDVDVELERSQPRITTSEETVISGPNIISTKKGPKDLTEVNSAQYLYWGMKAHRWTAVGITLFVVGLVGGTALLVRTYWRDIGSQPQAYEPFDISRVTTNGKSSDPALSPDGKFIAFVNSEGLERNIVIRQVATGTDVSIVKPKKTTIAGGLRFSTDGNYLYYVVVNGLIGALYRVPILGGNPKKIVEDLDSKIAFSPNGDRLAFVRWGDDTTDIVLTDADGSNEELFFRQDSGAAFLDIDWSPDGENFALVIKHGPGTGVGSSRLGVISLRDKAIQILSDKIWPTAGSIRWSSNGKSLTFVGQETRESQFQLWSLEYPKGGDAKKITSDHTDYIRMSPMANDGTRALERVEWRASVWSLDLRSKQTRQITTERVDQAGGRGIAQLSDGSLLLVKRESGKTLLSRLGGDAFRTETALDMDLVDLTDLRSSSDGRLVLMSSSSKDGYTISRMNFDGTDISEVSKPEPRPLRNPVLLPDNRTLLFIRDLNESQSALVRRNIESGEESQILLEPNVFIQSVSVSPDSASLAEVSTEVDYFAPDIRPRVRVFKLTDGHQLLTGRKLDTTSLGPSITAIAWTAEGSLLATGDADASNLFLENPEKGGFVKVTDFSDGMIYWVLLSRDGKEVFFVRVFRSSDILLMRDNIGEAVLRGSS